MDQQELDEAVATLKEKGVTKPCPRCSLSNFSIIGESEITVVKQSQPGLLGLAAIANTVQITMPIVIIACDNCGYVFQHAKASLVTPKNALAHHLGLLGRRK